MACTADLSRPTGRTPENAGGSVALVTAVQARNNARLVVAGSLAMFSDQFVHVGLTVLLALEAAGVGNAVFCTEVSQWALRERGMQRASDVAHSRTDGTVAELLLHQKDRRDLPFSLFSEPEIAKHSQVSLRPFKHNEYERFIGAAYPYYAGAFSMVLGFFAFSGE